MKGYKKYKNIHSISYIIFFSYLFIISISNYDFGGNKDYIPYFIIIPFVIYCGIALLTEILIRKEISISRSERKQKMLDNRAYNSVGMSTLSRI